MNKNLNLSQISNISRIQNFNYNSIPSCVQISGDQVIQMFKKGYKIHIKKENRGKFTDYCNGKVTSECIQRGKNSPDPNIRKRAVFADNARHFKHQNGGNIGFNGMIKSKLALESHFGNPTARRIMNYDTRTYRFPDGRKGNVYLGSYDNYVTPLIQDVDGELKLIENPWSKQNWKRSEAQSLKFNNPIEAEYFSEHYKEFTPMIKLYDDNIIGND